MSLSLRLRLKAATSSSVYGFDFHCRDDLVKIWMQSHPMDLPRPIDSATPPAIDMCAPSSGRPDEDLFAIFQIVRRDLIRCGGEIENANERGSSLPMVSA